MSTNNNKVKVVALVNDDEKHRDGDNYTHHFERYYVCPCCGEENVTKRWKE